MAFILNFAVKTKTAPAIVIAGLITGVLAFGVVAVICVMW